MTEKINPFDGPRVNGEMSRTIKNYVGSAIIIALVGVTFAAWSYVQTYSDSINLNMQRSFSVQGEGKVVAIPDVAAFTFSVLTQGGKEIAGLIKENTEKMNGAIAYAKSQGVEGKDIETQNYNLEPRYQYYTCAPAYDASGSIKPCPPAEVVGYTITQTVSVKVRDFGKVGDILSGVVKNGANTVSGLDFRIDDLSKIQNDARAKAITVAKEKAKMIADAGDFRVGKLLSIDEGYAPLRMMSEKIGYGMGGGDAAPVPAPTIEPGSQDVSVSVTLRYEIR